MESLISSNYKELCSNTNVNIELLINLRHHNIIPESKKQEIESIASSTTKASLLYNQLKGGLDEHIPLLIEALRESCNFKAAQIIEKEKQNHSNPSSSNNQISFAVTDTIYNFVGRKIETEELQSYFNGNGKRLVLLSGLGGIGKTELVRYFIKQLPPWEIICSWFNGDSVEGFKTSITQFAAQLGIKLGKTDKSETILNKIVSVIHQKYGQRRWLVVVDNVDEAHDEILNPIQFLRKQKNLFVIVTSRLRQLLGDEADLIEIEELLTKDAQQLVKNLKVSDAENIPRLCKKLQNYPLALQQAIAFIIQQQRHSVEGKSYGISNYLVKFEKEAQILLNFSSNSILDKYDKTTLVTWKVTMDSIRNNHGIKGFVAFKLLKIIAFLHPDGISLTFLSRLYSILYKSASERKSTKPKGLLKSLQGFSLHCFGNLSFKHKSTSEINFKKPVELLKSYSMVKVENIILSVHRLVQKVTQIQLKDSQSLLSKLLIGIDIENAEKVEMSHLIRLWKHAAETDELIQQFSYFPNELFEKLDELSLYSDLIEFCQINHGRLKAVLGEEHLHTLCIEHKVAYATRLKGDYEEALQLYKTVLEKQKRVFGEEHETTLVTENNIGIVLYDLKRYDEAITCWSKLLLLQKKIKGIDIKSIVTTKLNIALMLNQQGKYSEAMEKYEKVLNWRRDELGENHPDTLLTRHNIANCLYYQKMYTEAKVEFESVLNLRNERLGEDHSDTLTTKYMLGLSLYELGEQEKAVEILKQVLVLREKVLGVDHPHTINTRHWITFFTSTTTTTQLPQLLK